jgi:hypothetical protein
MSNALKKIERFIANLAASLEKEDTELGLKIEGAKVLAPYYSSLKKAEARTDGETDDDDLTMSGIQEQLAKVTEVGNGGTVPRHRRRRSSPADAN